MSDSIFQRVRDYIESGSCDIRVVCGTVNKVFWTGTSKNGTPCQKFSVNYLSVRDNGEHKEMFAVCHAWGEEHPGVEEGTEVRCVGFNSLNEFEGKDGQKRTSSYVNVKYMEIAGGDDEIPFL